MRIALFITCLTDLYTPRAGVAVVKVLRRLGHEVVFPRAQTCCGQPMFNNGYENEARALARRMMRVFAPYECVVTPSGSCAAMIREHYTGLFAPGTDDRAAAESLARRTYEFVEFLSSVERFDPGRFGARWRGSATYHYSCHHRGLGLTDEVTRLAGAIEGLELRELERHDECCGFGGTFCLKYPTVSGAMSADKAECVRRTGAGTLICNDAGCTMTIAGACRRLGVGVEVKSLAEILAEGLGLMDGERTR